MDEAQSPKGPPGGFPGYPTVQEQLDADFHTDWLETSTNHDAPTIEDGAEFVDPNLASPFDGDEHLGEDDSLRLQDDSLQGPPPDHLYPSQAHHPPGEAHPHLGGIPGESVQNPYEGYQYIREISRHDLADTPSSPPDEHQSAAPPPIQNHARRPQAELYHQQSETRSQGREREKGRPRARYDQRWDDQSRPPRDRRDDDDWYDRPRYRAPRQESRTYRRPSQDRFHPSNPQTQVYATNQPPPAPAAAAAAPGVNLGETMQMMMMSQMMQQQQQAQQMQAVQMASMMGKKAEGPKQCSRDSACGRKQGSMLVNIESGGKKRRVIRKKPEVKPMVMRKIQPVPVRVPILPPPLITSSVEESGGFENWQEATIILCLMIVGLTYLVSTRASATAPSSKDSKKAGPAKYINGPP